MSATLAAVASVLLGGPWLSAAPVPAATADPVTAPVALGAEAWYSSPKVCLAALCLPLPISPASTYPPQTLHIGALLGAESARTYLSLKNPIAADQVVNGGQLRRPLGTLPTDGSVAAEVAKVKACTTTATISRVSGSTAKPPAVNCSGAPVSRVVGTPATELDIELGPIARRLARPGTSLALLPVLSPGATFDVTVSSNRRAKSTATTPVLLLATTSRDATGGSGAPPSATGSDSKADDGDTLADVPSGPIDVGPLTSEPPASVSPPLIAAALTPEALHTSTTGFDYPVVFLVPLLLLAGVMTLGRQLTRPLTRGPS